MKCRNIALLTLAPLLLLPLGATSGSTDPETALVSPDGVALWDFTQGSTVWGRIFDFDPPEGVHERDIFSLCEFEGPGNGAAMWACLEPYVADVRWAPPGTPGAWEEVPREVGDSTLPDLPSLGFSTVDTADATFEVKNFTIYDDIDCNFGCDKNAEGYVIFSAWVDVNGGEWSVSGNLFCEEQSTPSGDCNVDRAISNYLVVPVGPNNCDGIKGRVEFWDDDGASDDRMDISIREGDAVADIEGTVDATTSPCDSEDNRWWSERGSSEPHECHGIFFTDPPTFCELTGQHDTGGDNDDAGLYFSAYPTPP